LFFKSKTYVQDLISKNFSSIHDLIFNKKGHIYICGDVKMAAEVTNVIEIGLKEKCKISLDEAKDYVNDMRV
jgi:nitric-oxide synthase